MRQLRFGTAITLFCLASQAFAAAQAADPSPDILHRIPLRFESLAPGKWIARGMGFGVGFTNDATIFSFGDRRLRLTMDGSNAQARLQGARKSGVPANYFGKPFRSVDAFMGLRRVGVYPGIDIAYYGQGEELEYDFDLAPGADPSLIRMRFDGADAVSLGRHGEVILHLGDREIAQNPPVVYQTRSSGEIVAVESSYRLEKDGLIGLVLGNYNRNEALVVDPTVLFTGYLSGTGTDVPVGIGQDKNGTIYIAGYTFSPDFVFVGQPYGFFSIAGQGNKDIFTTVMNPLGTPDQMVTYSGYLGGPFGANPTTMTVDSNGVFYIAGMSIDFSYPTTPTAFSTSNGGVPRSFVSVLDPSLPGTSGLTYSTFFAGSMDDQPTAIAVANGKIYVTGYTDSDDYPVTANAFQPTRNGGLFDGWVAEFDPTLSGTASLVASTYLGGSALDMPRTIAVSSDGVVYVGGYTFSTDFITTQGSYKPFYSGGSDGFLTRLDLNAGTVTYSTYLGGSDQEQVRKILIDPKGRVALTGYTLSTDFPVTATALQPHYAGNGDIFLTILDPSTTDFTKALVYSTYFGGSDGDVGYDMRMDASGKYYIGGYTLSRNLPTKNALTPRPNLGGSTQGLVAIIDPNAPASSALVYSSYLASPGVAIVYGVEVDSKGNVYLTGAAVSNVFITGQATPPLHSGYNVFLLVFHP